jgi:hypothetical protein
MCLPTSAPELVQDKLDLVIIVVLISLVPAVVHWWRHRQDADVVSPRPRRRGRRRPA